MLKKHKNLLKVFVGYITSLIILNPGFYLTRCHTPCRYTFYFINPNAICSAICSDILNITQFQRIINFLLLRSIVEPIHMFLFGRGVPFLSYYIVRFLIFLIGAVFFYKKHRSTKKILFILPVIPLSLLVLNSGIKILAFLVQGF
jgi:hypothetical protein